MRFLLLCSALLLTGCASLDRYVEAHRVDPSSRSFTFTQIGSVNWSGPFPIALLRDNQAWPATAADAQEIQGSFAVVLAQPVVIDGVVTYPATVQRQHTARIAHHVRGFADECPPPAWVGPVIHEKTVVPWSGDETIRTDSQWRYERSYESRHNDRPEVVTP